MKLSLAWIFDHIDADWKQINVAQLVELFNKTTAEIESWHKTVVKIDSFSLAQIISIYNNYVILHSFEWNIECKLPLNPNVRMGEWYLIRSHADNYSWATTSNLGSGKEAMLPGLFVHESLRAGAWKQQIELHDYILEIDNKSITNRPDLWGHRGFAREISAMLAMPFKPLDTFIKSKKIALFEQKSSSAHCFSTIVEDLMVCKRFASLYIPTIAYHPSLLWMVMRLCRTNNRPIDAIVDSANYVMLDISQPMHTYDASKIENNKVIIRYARPKEKLTILDGQIFSLTTDDLVIADGKKSMSLAGVVGGKNTAITSQTTAIFLESACFDPVTIRWETIRHKIRTEASTRFEKNLDPNQNINAIMRFLKLLDDAHIFYTAPEPILSIGARSKPICLDVELSFINKRLGVSIKVDRVVQILESLKFIVAYQVTSNDTVFTITVPTFRSSKEIRIKEDIVEEVGRFIGYDTIQPVMPSLLLEPSNLQDTFRLRHIKRLLSFGLSMREIQNYAFYDESFLRTIDWDPLGAVTVTDPVSENFKRLVTSLIPHLLQAIKENASDHKKLRFFEWARAWQIDKGDAIERKKLAGIIFDQTAQINFYDAKSLLNQLFALIDCPVAWHQMESVPFPWFAPFKTAHLTYEKKHIGIAGSMDLLFLQRFCAGGSAFIFELDGNFLLKFEEKQKKYELLPKYPAVNRDMSMLIPLSLTVSLLKQVIKAVDNRIKSVELIDFFQKQEWQDSRSVTLRLVIYDTHKTLTKDDVDLLWGKITAVVKKQGAIIR